MREKPDCSGQRFGRLIVLGKGEYRQFKHNKVQLWKLQCDCDNIIEIPRHSFEKKGQVSCGCKRRLGLVDNKRRSIDITGQRFGKLTAIALSGNYHHKKPTWLFQCDCGGNRELSLSFIRNYQREGIRINCGDRSSHPDKYLEYPATPSPYPQAAGDLLQKYLSLTELQYQKVDSAIEDEKRDRLLRAAWILVYRRQQGEDISKLHERRFIRKHLRYCSIDVFWKRKLENHGGMLYNSEHKVRQIGSKMTDLTSQDYPAIETLGIKHLPKNNGGRSVKRIRFVRR
ncbi:MAG: hypothetical protein PUP93_30995 [Rhizonema sp. NSF051]|nr:hypothetical protein [Rhizonema sp. NSF051]